MVERGGRRRFLGLLESVTALALGLAVSHGAAQTGVSPSFGAQGAANSPVATRATLPCAVYDAADIFSRQGGTLDSARVQELEARSVAAFLSFDAGAIAQLTRAYQAARSGLDAECAQMQEAVLGGIRGTGGVINLAARGPNFSPETLMTGWKTKMEAAFREFLNPLDSAKAAAALGSFRIALRWDALVSTVVEFNLDAERQAKALEAIRAHAAFLATQPRGNLVSLAPGEQESKARLDREIATLLSDSEAALWAARTARSNVPGAPQFLQSAVAGVTVRGRLSVQNSGIPTPQNTSPAATVNRGGGAPNPRNNLSFLAPAGGGRGGTAQIEFLAMNGVPVDGAGVRGRGGNAPRIEVQDDGSFQIGGVPPGVYRMIARANANSVQLVAFNDIEVGARNVDGVNMTLLPPVLEIRGQIYLSGSPPANFIPTALQVTLMPTEPRGSTPASGARGAVNSDYSFTLRNVLPLSYRVEVAARGASLKVTRAAYGENDALNAAIDVAGGARVLKVEIEFSR